MSCASREEVMPCVIVQWGVSYRAVSRKSRDCGGNQSPMTKPFYHVIFSDDRDDDLECYLYVPEGKICISISI